MCSVTQSCPTLYNPLNSSLPGSSVCGIFQAGILEWVAISFSMGSSRSRDQIQVSCIAGGFFTDLRHQGYQGKGSLGDEKYYSLLLCCPVIIHQLINYRLCLRLLLSYILIFLGEILDDVLRFIILHYSIMSVKIIIILHGG